MTKRATTIGTIVLAVVALLAFAISPALAHHKDGHDGGPPREQGAQNDESDTSAQGKDDDGIPDDNDDNRHPSGKDRETNDGPTDDVQGGDQTSNPDNDGHGPERHSCKGTSEDRVGGCADKPGGTGGVDQEDQDWNNGCGNDDDFEDDNEGLCLGQKPGEDDVLGSVIADSVEDDKTCPEIMGSRRACEENDDVLGRTDEAAPDAVLGTRFFAAPTVAARPQAVAAAAEGAALPFTGAPLIPAALVGLGLIATGTVFARKK